MCIRDSSQTDVQDICFKKMGKKNRTKHVIGCDLDASFIIENKRTRHCNSTMHELSTSFDKNLSKEKKKEEAPKTVVHECNVSTYSDTDKCYGFEHSENEKRKLLFFTELLEKMEMKNKNHMKSLSSGLKHCTVNINRLSTKAVSYTHLDVYKRQVFANRSIVVDLLFAVDI